MFLQPHFLKNLSQSELGFFHLQTTDRPWTWYGSISGAHPGPSKCPSPPRVLHLLPCSVSFPLFLSFHVWLTTQLRPAFPESFSKGWLSKSIQIPHPCILPGPMGWHREGCHPLREPHHPHQKPLIARDGSVSLCKHPRAVVTPFFFLSCSVLNSSWFCYFLSPLPHPK